MKKYDTWVVAAAILVDSNYQLTYTDLADRVIKSELTTLGMKGKNPEQTMGAMLRSKTEIFEQAGTKAYYGLCDKNKIADHPQVKEVLQQLRSGKPHDGSVL